MCMALPREAERRSGGGTAAKSGRRLAHRRVGVKAVLRQRDLRQQRGHERGGGRREPHRRPRASRLAYLLRRDCRSGM